VSQSCRLITLDDQEDLSEAKFQQALALAEVIRRLVATQEGKRDPAALDQRSEAWLDPNGKPKFGHLVPEGGTPETVKRLIDLIGNGGMVGKKP